MKLSKLSLFISLSIALGTSLVGCGLGAPPRDQQLQEGLLAREAFAQKFGVIEDRRAIAFLNSIALRLERGLPSYATPPYSVSLLATSTPIAVSVGGGFVLISKGLIRNLRNEAELAFVLAHEIAHDIRGDSRAYALGELSSEELQESEMHADKVGLGIMALAGYDPRPGLSALQHSYRALGYQVMSEEHSVKYPSPFERITALQRQIERSGWQPPGTIDRRDFQKLRLALASDMLK